MNTASRTGTISAECYFMVTDQLLRDCAIENLGMDATALYPRGFHPLRALSLPDLSGAAPYRSRIDATVRYYYIDFGISVHIPEHVHPKLVAGRLGRDQEVPELSDAVPYDPFKVDIFIIGNLIFKRLYKVSSSLFYKRHF